MSITVPASFALMMWCGYFDLLRRGVAWRGVIRDTDGSAYPRNSQGVAHKRCLPQSVSVIPDLRSNLSDISSPGFSGSGMEGAEEGAEKKADSILHGLCSRRSCLFLSPFIIAALHFIFFLYCIVCALSSRV